MKNFIKKILKNLGLLNPLKKLMGIPVYVAPVHVYEPYDFDKSNPLGGGGERVDITYNSDINFEKLDVYQKSHFRRYQFATETINIGDVCGDFACGTGYGSVMLVTKASQVIGMDLDTHVIAQIKERYKHIPKVQFYNDNLLNLHYENYFDCIISFETIEHFYEEDVFKLVKMYAKSLKPNGKLIFSTPYMQKISDESAQNGFHLTFDFNEEKVTKILAECGFELVLHKFQNYETHSIESNLEKKDFIITVAKKK